MPKPYPKRQPRLAETKSPYHAPRGHAPLTTRSKGPGAPLVPHPAAAAFAEAAYPIKGVAAVYARQSPGGALDIWTAVKRDDFELHKKVYEEEASLYERFPGLHFDFYVLSLDRLTDEDLENVVPPSFNLIPKDTEHAAGGAVPEPRRV